MKKFAALLISVVMSAGIFTVSADDETLYTPTEEGRQAMVNQLVGSKATPEVAAPFSDGDALPITPGMPTVVYDSRIDSYGMSTTSKQQLDPNVARTTDRNYGRYRVACHGKAVNSLGYDYVAVINYSSDSFNKFTVYCYNTTDNALISQAAEVSLTTVPNFITDKSYLKCVRSDYAGKSLHGNVDLDPFSGTASTTMRNNEVLNSFVSLTAVDLDHDGTEEPIFCDGKNIYVFTFTSSRQLVLSQTIAVSDTAYGTASCTSLAYDVDGDGNDDYVAIVIPDANKDVDNSKMFFTFLTHSSDGITVTRSEVTNSQQGFFYYKNSYRAMINASKFCPTGLQGETWLAVATTSVINDTETSVRGMQKLAIVSTDWAKIQNGDAIWYDLKTYMTCTRGDWYQYYNRKKNTFYDDYHLKSASYGKPTLSQGFLEGIGAPASLLWEEGIFEWEPTTKNLSQKGWISAALSNFRFVGGNSIATSLGSKTDFNVNGKEVFAVAYTDVDYVSYDSGTTYCYSYQYDKDLKLACISYDNNDYNFQTITLNGSVDASTPGVSMLAQPLIEGLQLKLLQKRVTVSTPNIECVLAVPPYVDGKSNGKGSVLFTNSQSSTQSMTESTSQSVGVSVGLGFDFLSCLKIGIQSKYSESWTNSMSKNQTFTQTTIDTVDKGEDMVAFTYVPVDVFDYEIVSDNPNYNGQTFSLMRARSAGIKHDVMPMRNYNQLVGPAGGLVIDSSILPHTPGDVSTYAHCPEADQTPNGARQLIYDTFGVKEDEIIGMSNIYDVPSEGATKNISLGYGEGGTVSEGGSESVDVSLSFSLSGVIPFAINTSVNESTSQSWSMSTGWNKNVTIQGSVPYIVDKADNFYSYRLVWYRVHRTNADGADKQDFMVGNWIICEDQTGDVSSVNGIGVDKKPFDARVFTIDGRYVGSDADQLSPGIYIRNGHKIVVTR